MAVYQLNVNGNIALEYCQNVLHFDVAESGSHTPYEYATDLVAYAHAHFRLPWEAICPSDYVLTSFTARKVDPPGGPLAVHTYPFASETGARGTSEVGGCGACLLFPVLLAGKNVTGRIFVPGAPTGDFVSNVPIAGYATVLAAFNTFLLTVWALVTTGVNAQYCIYKRSTHTNAHAVISRVSQKVGTQRRRYTPVP